MALNKTLFSLFFVLLATANLILAQEASSDSEVSGPSTFYLQKRFPWAAIASAVLGAFTRREAGISLSEVTLDQTSDEGDQKHFPWPTWPLTNPIIQREDGVEQFSETDEENQKRFPWGALVSGILSAFANREGGLSEQLETYSPNQTSEEGDQKRISWGAIASGILNAFAKRKGDLPESFSADIINQSSEEGDQKRFPWGAIASEIISALANREGGLPQTAADFVSETSSEERAQPVNIESQPSDGEEQRQDKLFFSVLSPPVLSTCNYTTEAGADCASCTVTRRCLPSNVSINITCRGLFRYCNNGRCSIYQGSACSATTSTSSTSSSSTTTTTTTTTTTPPPT